MLCPVALRYMTAADCLVTKATMSSVKCDVLIVLMLYLQLQLPQAGPGSIAEGMIKGGVFIYITATQWKATASPAKTVEQEREFATGKNENQCNSYCTANCAQLRNYAGNTCDRLVIGLPCLLTAFVPGQEEGNIGYVWTNSTGLQTICSTALPSMFRLQTMVLEPMSPMRLRVCLVHLKPFKLLHTLYLGMLVVVSQRSRSKLQKRLQNGFQLGSWATHGRV